MLMGGNMYLDRDNDKDGVSTGIECTEYEIRERVKEGKRVC